ncbi:MAG: biotin--[acetyl-CoA-carboxylase] ligase [Limnohabitans sp.]|nr:biotin--[acetyl-CoA-carboxylase] ligase [Limnohabitans sp.]
MNHTKINWPKTQLKQEIEQILPDMAIEMVDSIDSTNDELMRRIRSGNTTPTLLMAQYQTAGKGRHANPWHAKPGECLMFSLCLPMDPLSWSGLSLVVGLSIVQSLDPDQQLGLKLKWPNDIWMGSVNAPKKLAGILIETAMPTVRTTLARSVVVGVGINIATPTHDCMRIEPIGFQELESNITAPDLLLRLARTLIQDILSFAQTGFSILQDHFHKRDILFMQEISLSDGRIGVAMGVDNHGQLKVQGDSELWLINSSEIQIRSRS